MAWENKTKVVHMVTSACSVGLMKGQLSYLIDSGYDVTVISSPGSRLKEIKSRENVKIKAISMERSISLIKDLISLIRLILYFLKVKPEICNAGTPKAGLLGMIAAWLTRVPYKVYTVRGLPFEESSGLKKKILMLTEKVACASADRVICISPSLKNVMVDLNLTSKEKTVVFGSGSSNGIQLEKFEYNDEISRHVKDIKSKLNLVNYKFIIGYVGRINSHKGINELVIAFENLQKKYDKIGLLLIGSKESKNAISKEIDRKIAHNPNIIETGRVENPVPYYYLMNVLAFPTYREGFGNVSIEAQATGTPVVTTNATGAVDTVVNNKTGFIVNTKDEVALQEKLEKLIKNQELIKEMGIKAKRRVENHFESKKIWKSLENMYKSEYNSSF